MILVFVSLYNSISFKATVFCIQVNISCTAQCDVIQPFVVVSLESATNFKIYISSYERFLSYSCIYNIDLHFEL